MNRMAGEVKARVGELTAQRDLLSVVFGGLVEGVIVVGRDRRIALVNDAAKPLIGGGSELPDALAPLVEPRARRRAGRRGARAGRPLGARQRAAAPAIARPAGARAPGAPTRGRSWCSTTSPGCARSRRCAASSSRTRRTSCARRSPRSPATPRPCSARGVDRGDLAGFPRRDPPQRAADRARWSPTSWCSTRSRAAREAVGSRAPIALAEVVGDARADRAGRGARRPDRGRRRRELSVLGTRDGLDHIVQNLIDNAIKYGGDTPVTVRVERVARRVRLAVSDRGSGNSGGPRGAHFRAVLPARRRAQPRPRRLGLGLAIVKSQVEAMGGRVWVEHAAPGARFVVELGRRIERSPAPC